MTTSFFYLLSGLLLSSAFMVVRGMNTVYGVFFLIFAFFNAAGLLLMLHAEFLAFILLIVYVGAVAVLFLFVVMMLGEEQKAILPAAPPHVCSRRYALAVGLLFLLLLEALGLMAVMWHPSSEASMFGFAQQTEGPNTQALGQLLYTHYLIPFQGVGLILLIAMVGVIILTLRHREGVRKPQHCRAKADIRFVDLPRLRQGGTE